MSLWNRVSSCFRMFGLHGGLRATSKPGCLDAKFTQRGRNTARLACLVLGLLLMLSHSGRAVGTLVPASGRVDHVYDPARKRLYITNGSSVLVYDVTNNTFLSPYTLGGNLKGIDISPDNNTLAVADSTYGTTESWIWIVDLVTGLSRKFSFPRDGVYGGYSSGEGGSYAVAFANDGSVLVTTDYLGSGWTPLRRLYPASGVVTPIANVRNVSMVSASSDGAYIGIAEADSSAGPVDRYRVADSTFFSNPSYGAGTGWFNYEIAVNNNGTQYAVPTYNGTYIYDGNLQYVTKLGAYAAGQGIGCAYHPTQNKLYLPWATTSQIKIFDSTTFQETGSLDFEQYFDFPGNWSFQNGRAKVSRDGTILSCSVTGGVRFISLNQGLTFTGANYTTNEDTALPITLNAYTSSGQPVTYTVYVAPEHGTLSVFNGNQVTYTPAKDYNGTDVFSVTAQSGQETAIARFAITINPVNDAPVARGYQYSTPEDTPIVTTLHAIDVDSSNLTYSIVYGTADSGPKHGKLGVINGNQVTYTPDPNWNGTDSFVFRASDGQLSSNIATNYITVTPVNDPPTASDVNTSTNENSPVIVTMQGADIDSTNLTYSITSKPAHGGVGGQNGNQIVYTPATNYSGTDSFTYTVSDGSLTSNTATVTITVNYTNNNPVANNQSVSTNEDTPLPVTLMATDTEGDLLTYSLVSYPVNGTLSGTLPNLAYTPNPNFNGTDSFTFKANDGQGDSNVATIAITVKPVNDAPVAANQSVTTDEDTPINVTLSAQDVDGDPLTYSVVDAPAHGTLSGTAPNLTYTPDPNWNGTDAFTFTANDGQIDSKLAMVTIKVNAVSDTPIAHDDAYSVNEDQTLSVPTPGVLQNDEDIDGTGLTAKLVSTTTKGALTLNPDGSFTYVPNANFNGQDTFTYAVASPQLTSVVATVTIKVIPVNDAPIAQDQSISTDEDTPKSLLLGVKDVDGDTLTYNIVTPPGHGSLSGTAPNLTYTPAQDYNGADSFTFKANDGQVDSNVATVSLTIKAVNDAPKATNLNLTTVEDTALSLTLSASDTEGDPLTYSVVTQPAHGTLSGTAPNLTYTPAKDYNGADNFTFKANDGQTDSNVATASITVTPVNDAPVASDGSATTNEDTAVKLTLVANDVDAQPLSYKIVIAPTHGTLTAIVGNQVTYTPAANYNGSDSFTFQASDGQLNSNTAKVSLTIVPVNDLPVAVADTGSTAKNTAVTLAVLANDSDVDGDTLTITSAIGAKNGTTTIVNIGTAIRYTPKSGFGGTDSFTYTISDGHGGTASATVTVTVAKH